MSNCYAPALLVSARIRLLVGLEVSKAAGRRMSLPDKTYLTLLPERRGSKQYPPKFSHFVPFPAFLRMLRLIPALNLPRSRFRKLNYMHDVPGYLEHGSPPLFRR